MKKETDVRAQSNLILQALPKGILVNTQAAGRFNSMVIGWGMLGTVWGKPVFITYVRTSRYTYEQLEKNPEFTVSIPLDGKLDPEIFRVCGSLSGRDVHKDEELGLTLVPGDTVSVPGIKEVPATLECKVIYRQMLDGNALPSDIRERLYKGFGTAEGPDPEHELHAMFYGEVTASYVIEDQ